MQWWLGPEAGTLTPVRWWRSDRYGLRYPVDWIIDTPAGRYAVAPYFDEQTMPTPTEMNPINYWEGIVRVREGSQAGPQVGVGYMELANYP